MRSCWSSRQRCTWPGSRARTPTSRGGAASTSRGCCAAPTARTAKVRHETLANLTRLPGHVVDAVEAALKGDALTAAQGAGGHDRPVAAARPRRRRPGDGLESWGSRGCSARPARSATSRWPWSSPASCTRARNCPPSPGGPTRHSAPTSASRRRRPTTCTRRWTGCRPGRTPSRRGSPAATSPRPRTRQRMALFDLSSSWLEGTHCPLGERGYSRDGKKGKVQIEYGLLTDPEGRPVAVRVLEGNTADPAAFTEIAEVVRGTGSGCGRWSWSATAA